MHKTYFYPTSKGGYPVKEFIEEFDKKSQAKIYSYIDLLKQHGPQLLRPYADLLREKIRELRIRLKDGNVRLLYFFFQGHNIIFVHAFKKKTWEVPEREFTQAKANMEDFIIRYDQGEIEL